MAKSNRKVTTAVRLPANGEWYFGVESESFFQYIGRVLGEVYDRYGRRTEQQSEVSLLRNPRILQPIEQEVK